MSQSPDLDPTSDDFPDFPYNIHSETENEKGEMKIEVFCPHCDWSRILYEHGYQPEGFVPPRRLAMIEHWKMCPKFPA